MARTATQVILGTALALGLAACGESFENEPRGSSSTSGTTTSGTTGTGGCATPPCSTCADPAVAALMDDFEDGIASSAWIPYQTTGTTVQETLGELRIEASTRAVPPAEAGYFSSETFAFDECALSVRLRQAAGAPEQPGALTYVQLTSAAEDSNVAFTVTESSLRFVHQEGGQPVDEANVEFDPAAHVYLRFFELGDVLRLQTSADGQSWTDQLEMGSPSFLVSSRYRLGAGVVQAPDVPLTARFDDVNMVP